MSEIMSDDHLLDDNILVPQTQPSPHSFSTQLVKRLRIKSFTNQRGDAVNPNTNTVLVVKISQAAFWLVSEAKMVFK